MQHPTLMAWNGKQENKEIAQNILYKRSEANGNASIGIYDQKLDLSIS